MNRLIRMFVIIAAMVLCGFAGTCIASADTVAQGNCGAQGNNLTWILDSEGTITISGSGAMKSYKAEGNSDYEPPWYDYHNSIKKIVIENGVTSIGEGAFFSCSNVPNISFPNSVKSIGKEAFLLCTGLTGTLNLPDSLESLGEKAFYNCKFTGGLTIPGSVKTIGDSAFAYCDALTGTLTISNGVKYIGEYAFYNCEFLTGDLIIPNSVKAIGKYAFCDCYGNGSSSLYYTEREEFVLSDNLTVIEEGTFKGCSRLGQSGIVGSDEEIFSFTIPNNVTEIGDDAFNGCGGIGKISFMPGNIQSIGARAFKSCGFMNDKINLPDSLESIGEEAFSGCEYIKAIDIGYLCTEIGDDALRYCGDSWIPYGNTFTIYGYTGSVAETYANDNNIAFVSVGSIANNELDFSKDIFGFGNFSHNGCEIPEYDINALKKLPTIEYSLIREKLSYGARTGHCYGLSVVTCLNKMKKIEFGSHSSCDNLRSESKGGAMTNLACIYHATFSFRCVDESIVRCLRTTQKVTLNRIARKANNVKNGGSPIVIYLNNCKNGENSFCHAVVGYGLDTLEPGNYFTSPKSGKKYDSRIKIYDVNSWDWDENYCLLFNYGTDEWEIPKYYSDYNISSKNQKSQLAYIGNTYEMDALNNSKHYLEYPMLICQVPGTYNLDIDGKDYLIDWNNGEVTGSESLISYSEPSSSDGEGSMNVVLPEGSSKYVISNASENDDSISMSLLTNDSLAIIKTESADKCTVDENKVLVENNEGELSLSMVSDEVEGKELCSYELKGTCDGNVSLEQTIAGVKIKGDDINDMTMTAFGDDKEEHIYQIEDSSGEKTISDEEILGSGGGTEEITPSMISSISDQTYTGSAITPELTITDEGTTLIKDTDYTVTYENNVNVGTAKAIVTGIGNYTGTVTVEFTIKEDSSGGGSSGGGGTTGGGGGAPETTEYTVTFNCQGHGSAVQSQTVKENEKVTKPADPKAEGYVFGGWFTDKNCTSEWNFTKDTVTKDITLYAKWTEEANSIKDCQITLNPEEFAYTGKVQKPAVTVKNPAGKLMTEGTDYTLDFVNSKNIGAYEVTVTGAGNYKDSAKASYKINPSPKTVKGIKSVKPGKKKLTVKWTKASKTYLKQVNGYEICYATDKSFETAKAKTASVKSTSKTITGLKAKQKYYVKMRSYKTVDGQKYYSTWSKVKTGKTK